MPGSQNQNIKLKQYCNQFNPLKMVHIKKQKQKQKQKNLKKREYWVFPHKCVSLGLGEGHVFEPSEGM